LAQFANPDQDKVDKNTNEQVDRQYKSALDKTRSSKAASDAKVDPWSNMRGTDPAKPKK
jgi:predicted metal-dependent peptidase